MQLRRYNQISLCEFNYLIIGESISVAKSIGA